MSEAEAVVTTIHGLPFYAGRFDDAVDAVIQRAVSRRGGYGCFAGAHLSAAARRSDELAAALSGSWATFPDGAPIAWLQSRTIPNAERIAGPDLMPAVLDRGRERGLRHFFLGTTDRVLEGLCTSAVGRFPGLKIAGSLPLPFRQSTASELSGVLETVRSSDPHIVWLAIGAPRQELWACSNASRLSPALVLAVGAAFDFIAGAKARAPLWMRRRGLEWLYRFAQEPRRLGPRYVAYNSRFLWAEMAARLRRE